MSETTVNKIVEAAQKTAVFAEKLRQQAFQDMMTSLAREGLVEIITVTGGTPSFNDGEPCTHRLRSFCVNFQEHFMESEGGRGFDYVKAAEDDTLSLQAFETMLELNSGMPQNLAFYNTFLKLRELSQAQRAGIELYNKTVGDGQVYSIDELYTNQLAVFNNLFLPTLSEDDRRLYESVDLGYGQTLIEEYCENTWTTDFQITFIRKEDGTGYHEFYRYYDIGY